MSISGSSAYLPNQDTTNSLGCFRQNFLAAKGRRHLAPSESAIDFSSRFTAATPRPGGYRATRPKTAFEPFNELADRLRRGIRRRWARERRRRKVGRAYDMALEIARVIPRGAEVLDVGCGNGFISHHLSAILGTRVFGIDVAKTTEAPIDYRCYDGLGFPVRDGSFDAVLLCYVLHHAQEVSVVLSELRRVLRAGGLAVVYEDIPRTRWDRAVCWIHNRQWRNPLYPLRRRHFYSILLILRLLQSGDSRAGATSHIRFAGSFIY